MKNEGKEVLVSARGVKKEFPGRQEKEQILKDIDVDIYAGDFTVIMGSSGAGKSTLLYALSGQYHRREGAVPWKGNQQVYGTSDGSTADA